MFQHTRLVCVVAVLGLLASDLAKAQPAGTAFTYQGQLKDADGLITGQVNLEFSLWNDPNSTDPNDQVGLMLPVTANVDRGLFTTVLDFGSDAFTGEARWLNIVVEGSPLSPRQELTPTPYALALPGLRTEPDAYVPNIIGGYVGNSVADSVYGATIGGGGVDGFINTVSNHWGTIGGGDTNTVSGAWGTVSGGSGNTASDYAASVAGGWNNSASSQSATVGGGSNNTAVPHISRLAGATITPPPVGAARFLGGQLTALRATTASRPVGGRRHATAGPSSGRIRRTQTSYRWEPTSF
jgi:hypothetical protein